MNRAKRKKIRQRDQYAEAVKLNAEIGALTESQCRYPNCGAILGPWKPDYFEQIGTCETRTCEKCGGQQIQWAAKDAETLKAIDALFKELK